MPGLDSQPASNSERSRRFQISCVKQLSDEGAFCLQWDGPPVSLVPKPREVPFRVFSKPRGSGSSPDPRSPWRTLSTSGLRVKGWGQGVAGVFITCGSSQSDDPLSLQISCGPFCDSEHPPVGGLAPRRAAWGRALVQAQARPGGGGAVPSSFWAASRGRALQARGPGDPASDERGGPCGSWHKD